MGPMGTTGSGLWTRARLVNNLTSCSSKTNPIDDPARCKAFRHDALVPDLVSNRWSLPEYRRPQLRGPCAEPHQAIRSPKMTA
jgi:hypothetical protein